MVAMGLAVGVALGVVAGVVVGLGAGILAAAIVSLTARAPVGNDSARTVVYLS